MHHAHSCLPITLYPPHPHAHCVTITVVQTSEDSNPNSQSDCPLHTSRQITNRYPLCDTKYTYLFIYYRLITQSTAHDHPRAYQGHSNRHTYITNRNSKPTNIHTKRNSRPTNIHTKLKETVSQQTYIQN